MFRRLLILQLLALGGLSSVFLLPKVPDLQSSAIVTDSQDHPDLPGILVSTGWTAGPRIKPAEKELQALADDTNFARRDYTRQVAGEMNPNILETLQASIVLSGKDLNNSLHRPERCLPAQGLNIQSSTEMPVPLPGGNSFKLTKLHCTATDKRTGNSYVYLNYYWFVGHDSFKNTHYGRTLKDMKDRLLQGYDQRWAYITVSLNLVTGQFQDETGRVRVMKAPDEAGADRMVTDFIRELAPEIVRLKDIKDWD